MEFNRKIHFLPFPDRSTRWLWIGYAKDLLDPEELSPVECLQTVHLEHHLHAGAEYQQNKPKHHQRNLTTCGFQR